jgi:hypothetical protein
MAERSKRTDPHRPGAITPADYEHVLSFSLASSNGGWPIPAIGVNCELDNRVIHADGRVENGQHQPDGQCCTIGLRLAGEVFARHGGPGKCDICGAHYIYGDVWRHLPTRELIFLGHDCVAKYEMLADRSAWELQNGRVRAAAATACLRAGKAQERARFLAEHPGLDVALDTDHPIVRDIKGRFTRWASVSEKQVALVFKLAHEAANPEPEEVLVKAPTGKVTFRGTVVSWKRQEMSSFDAYKGTVKVKTPEGIWLAWGTIPASILDESAKHGPVRGCEVEITATLLAGREPHFAIIKRPKGKLLKPAGCPPICRGCLGDEAYFAAYEAASKVTPDPFAEFEVAS